MKKVKIWGIFMLMVMMATVFKGCSKDNDSSSFELRNYIIGTWHSYKATVYVQGGAYSGKSAEATINKTGQYSEAYFEFAFQDTSRVKFGLFRQEENGLSHWVEGYGTYSINGDIVTVRIAEGETLDLIFNEKDKTLCIQIKTIQDGIPLKMIIYLKK